MIYRKNIYAWEQLVRIFGGIALGIVGFALSHGSTVGYASIAAGLGLAVTGLVGWCPICAVGGRRLRGEDSASRS